MMHNESVICLDVGNNSVRIQEMRVIQMQLESNKKLYEDRQKKINAVRRRQKKREAEEQAKRDAEEKQHQYRAEVFQKTKLRLEAWAAIEEEKERKIEEEARQ